MMLSNSTEVASLQRCQQLILVLADPRVELLDEILEYHGICCFLDVHHHISP